MTHPHDPYAPQDPYIVEAKRPENGDAKTPVATPDETPEVEVPKGTTAEVSDWVGSNKERAQQALDAEEATGKPRKTLVADLKEILEK